MAAVHTPKYCPIPATREARGTDYVGLISGPGSGRHNVNTERGEIAISRTTATEGLTIRGFSYWTRYHCNFLGNGDHCLLEVPNISFSTNTKNDRTVLMRTNY